MPLYPKKPGRPGVTISLDFTPEEARFLRLMARSCRYRRRSPAAAIGAYIRYLVYVSIDCDLRDEELMHDLAIDPNDFPEAARVAELIASHDPARNS